jgi:hypothetical protein
MKADEVIGMQESYDEGLTNHIDPESCAYPGNGISEALTGERAGWVLSPESDISQSSADAVDISGRQNGAYRKGEGCADSAGSETPCMYGHTSDGNREIPCPPPRDSGGGRAVNQRRERQR